MNFDERYMRMALDLAREAGRLHEVPVGAVVVAGDAVVGRGRNTPVGSVDPTAHAEIAALREAARTLDNYRLTGTTLYVSVEPCLMCLGAAIHARVGRLVFAADDPKVGATGRLAGLQPHGAGFNHAFEIVGGVLADEAAGLLLDFFGARRGVARAPGQETRGEVPKWS